MANKRITDLTAATSVTGAEVFPFDNATPNSRKITAANLARSMAVLQFRGALVKKSVDQTAANYTAGANIAWDAEEYDTDSIHDLVTNNSRLTVPSGASYVRLSSGVRINNITADTYARLLITKGGANAIGMGQTQVEAGTTTLYASVISSVVAVSAADYFEINLTSETDNSIDIIAAQSWFAMEIIA